METISRWIFLVLFINRFVFIESINRCFEPGLCLGKTIEVRETDDKFECLKICQNEFKGICRWASFKDQDKACVLSRSCQTLLRTEQFATKYEHASARCTG